MLCWPLLSQGTVGLIIRIWELQNMKRILLICTLLLFNLFISTTSAKAQGYYLDNGFNVIYDLSTFEAVGFSNQYSDVNSLRLLDCYRKTIVEAFYNYEPLCPPEDYQTPKYNGKDIIYLIFKITYKEKDVTQEYQGAYGLPHYATHKDWVSQIKYIGFITGEWVEYDGHILLKDTKKYYNKNTSLIPNFNNHLKNFTDLVNLDKKSVAEPIVEDMTEKFPYAYNRNQIDQFPQAEPTLNSYDYYLYTKNRK